MIGRGLDAEGKECRTIDKVYAKSSSGCVRLNRDCRFASRIMKLLSYLSKDLAWWILLIDQPEGLELDKFVRDAMWGEFIFQISHKCHWAFCYVVSHHALVMVTEDSDCGAWQIRFPLGPPKISHAKNSACSISRLTDCIITKTKSSLSFNCHTPWTLVKMEDPLRVGRAMRPSHHPRPSQRFTQSSTIQLITWKIHLYFL